MTLAPLLLAWKHRKVIGIALTAVAVVWALWVVVDGYGDRRAKRAADEVRALWEADTAARQLATDKAMAQVREAVEASQANNVRVLRDANEKLVAIAADRASLSGLLRAAEERVRRARDSAATSQLGTDVATGIAASAATLDRLRDEYDTACRRDAVRFKALQDEIRPQSVLRPAG